MWLPGWIRKVGFKETQREVAHFLFLELYYSIIKKKNTLSVTHLSQVSV